MGLCEGQELFDSFVGATSGDSINTQTGALLVSEMLFLTQDWCDQI